MFDRDRGVFRLVRGFGPAEFDTPMGFVLVYEWNGVKEWDGRVLRRWVEVTRVGFKMGPTHPVYWYRSL